ncbi:MAG TPA: hypothetical protein VIK50_11490 [Gemmatimonadaceae bacterium]
MTETQQRFLKAIAERVTTGRVAELRLYPTVRVGPIESGVAIVATEMGEGRWEMGDDTSETPLVEGVPSDHPRLSIHTANFRLTVKGPDRGKWEFAMVHDADAPIETVESVVRGVARRAGEDGEPELLSGDDFQRAIAEPWWTATA